MVLDSIVRYADDTAGLEKSLRLFQGFCTIAAGLPAFASDLETVMKLRSQLALGRRYFRLLKWSPCWSSALDVFSKKDQPSLMSAIEFGKWSFLGMYFFLEMFTIGDALGVTASGWGPMVQREANKCWFYALVLSIFLGLREIMYMALFQRATDVTEQAKGTTDGSNSEATKPEATKSEATESESTKSEAEPTRSPAKSAREVDNHIYTQLIIDSCDLFIPGAAVGWLPMGLVFVGTASTVSSLLAGRQIWDRVQQRAPRP